MIPQIAASHISDRAVSQALFRPLLVEITLNHQRLPTIVRCYQDMQKRIWMKDQDLKELSMHFPKHAPWFYQKQTLYQLNWYSGLRYRFNRSRMALDLWVPPRFFFEQKIRSPVNQTNLFPPSEPGAFLNYDFSVFHNVYFKESSQSALFDFGLFNHFGTGHNDVLINKRYPNRWMHLHSAGSQVVRLDTQWVLDQPDQVSSWRLGDSITGSSAWSGATRFAGIQYATNFLTQPNLVTFPLPGMRGEATLPSTLSVFVNHVLHKKQAIENGPYVFDDIPVITGEGTVNIVTEDVLGRRQVVSFPYYASNQLLKRGLSNFSYEAGFVRRNYGVVSNDYRRFLAVATYARGISDRLTLGAHTELLLKQQTLGASLDYLWKHYGVISFALAGAHKKKVGPGALLSFGFNRQTSQFSYGLKTTWASVDYRQLGDDRDVTGPGLISQFFCGYNGNRYGGFSASYTLINRRIPLREGFWGFPEARLLTLNYNTSFLSRLSFNASFIRDLYRKHSAQFLLSLILSLDSEHQVSDFTNIQSGNVDHFVRLSKNFPAGVGYGYNVVAGHGRNQYLGADVGIQNTIGTYFARVMRTADALNYELDASGSAIYFGGDYFLSRKLINSFAVVQIPSFEGINVLYRNQSMGMTNQRGNLLIPELLPYQANKIELNPASFPLNTRFTTIERTVYPYFHSGVLLTFALKRVHGVVMHLVTPAGEAIPAGANVTLLTSSAVVGASLQGQAASLPVVTTAVVGYEGEVYLDNVSSTTIRGAVTWEDNQRCLFLAKLPKNPAPIVQLGRVFCVPRRTSLSFKR